MRNGLRLQPDEDELDELSFDEDPNDSASEIGDYGEDLDDELVEREPAHHHHHHQTAAVAPAVSCGRVDDLIGGSCGRDDHNR